MFVDHVRLAVMYKRRKLKLCTLSTSSPCMNRAECSVCRAHLKSTIMLSTQSAPLRQLLEEKDEWLWSHEQEESFITLKRLITQEPVLKKIEKIEDFSWWINNIKMRIVGRRNVQIKTRQKHVDMNLQKSFDSSLYRGRSELTCYKYNIKTPQNLSAIKQKILSKNTTPHVTGIDSGPV